MIFGFAWGGWSTKGTTQKKAGEAVLARQAAICVAQFIKQPNHEEELKELVGLDSYNQGEFIEKGAGMMPPPAFAQTKQLIQKVIGNDWAELTRRIPTLT